MKKTIKIFFRRLIIKLLKKILPIPQEFIEVLILSFFITLAIVVALYALANTTFTKTYKAPEVETTTQVIVEKKTETPKVKKFVARTEIDEAINKYFPENPELVRAILMHESRLNTHAINYNCYYKGNTVYTDKVAGAYSTFCKKGHAKYAWSVDCGIAMLNYHGQVCPAWTFELEPSLKKMQSMVATRGLSPWVSYTSGAYKQYLTMK